MPRTPIIRRPIQISRQSIVRDIAPQQQNVYANGGDLSLWTPYEVVTDLDMTIYNPVTKVMGVAKITEALSNDYHQVYGFLPTVHSPRLENIVNKWFCISAKVKAGTNKYVVLNPFFGTGDSYIIFDIEAGTIFAQGSFEDPEVLTGLTGSIRSDGNGFMDIAFICLLNPNGKGLVSLVSGVSAVGSARPIDGFAGFVFQGTGLDFYCAAAQGTLCNHLTPFAYAGIDENVDNGDPRNIIF